MTKSTKPRKQTRRSISLSQKSYQTLKAYCQAHNMSMSGWLEDQVAKAFNTPSREPLFPSKETRESKEIRGGGIHSF